MFIMLAAWRKTDTSLTVTERIADTLEDAGVSITITSLTDLLAFGIGSLSPLPAIKTYCLFTAIAVLFDFFYQITFFGGFMVLFGYMESFNCHGVSCLPSPQSGQRLRRNDVVTIRSISHHHVTEIDNTRRVNSAHSIPAKQHIIMCFFRDYYAKLISKPISSALVLILYVCYIGLSGYFLTTLVIGVEEMNIAKQGTMTFDYLEIFSQYFAKTGPSVSVAFTEPYPYWQPDKQIDIEQVLLDFHDNSHIQNRNNTEFWLDAYIKYLRTSYGTAQLDQNTFVTVLKDQFLKLPCCEKYKLDINFNGSVITSSRFILASRDLLSSKDENDLLLDVRKSVDEATEYLGIHVIASSIGFGYAERYQTIVPTTLLTLGIAVISMLLVFLIIIPNISVGLLVTFSVGSILFGVLGFMASWGVPLGSISMINLVLCIGFSVDFSAHIAYAFVKNLDKPELSSSTKLSNALYLLGYPILQSGVSTICAVFLMFWSKSHILQTFAKIITLIMGFGMLHGLLFLPVMITNVAHIRHSLRRFH